MGAPAFFQPNVTPAPMNPNMAPAPVNYMMMPNMMMPSMMMPNMMMPNMMIPNQANLASGGQSIVHPIMSGTAAAVMPSGSIPAVVAPVPPAGMVPAMPAATLANAQKGVPANAQPVRPQKKNQREQKVDDSMHKSEKPP